MKKRFIPAVLLLLFGLLSLRLNAAECPPLLNFERQPLAKKEQLVNLCQQYQGKVILVVNTASKCGYTYQYDGLEELYRRYQARGLVVLGFPSNDFAGQEPGGSEQIESFCRLTYGVKFPMFEKSSVAAGTSDPLFKALAAAAGGYPEWNFHKYLIDRNGKLVASYPSRSEPLGKEIVATIEKLL
jgi:glutathione peroxidase